MEMYYALAWAYGQCRDASDAQAYEECLWKALSDILKRPIEGGNDLVIVVDGIDEITGPQTTPSAVLEKLVQVASQAARTRLIALSTSTTSASSHGSHHEITHENIHDDIHTVILRALIHNHHFHGKHGHEQEALLDRLIHAARGSFLWAIIACEVLSLEKTNESFNKTVETLVTSEGNVQDLVLRLFTSLAPSGDAKTLLSWLLAAERPLTMEEIHCLFSVDVHRGTITDRGVDVKSAVHSLRPFLTVQDHIVCFKHR